MLKEIVKNMIETLPEEKLKNIFEVLTNLMEEDNSEAWAIWEEFGKDAVAGKWEDASERHDFYLYGKDL